MRKDKMKAEYDGKLFKLTPRFIKATEELMLAEIEMMKRNDPEFADCWVWGICEVSDIASSAGLSIYFGSEEDKPKDFPEHTNVWVKAIH